MPGERKTHSAPVTGPVTDEQIQAWKDEHGDMFAYEADGKKCYLKRPSRTTIAAASTAGAGDPFRFAEIILTNCWLGGDEILRKEDKYFMGLSQKIDKIVEITVGEIKKL